MTNEIEHAEVSGEYLIVWANDTGHHFLISDILDEMSTPKPSATVQDGNAWMHPEFNVSVDNDNDIVIETETTVMSYQITAARDLVQALSQAIAAAELIEVQDGAK